MYREKVLADCSHDALYFRINLRTPAAIHKQHPIPQAPKPVRILQHDAAHTQHQVMRIKMLAAPSLREKGAVMLIMAGSMVMLLGVTALVIDVANYHQLKRQAQASADSSVRVTSW